MAKPIILTRQELARLLEGMAKAVRAGDSIEGTLTYTAMDPSVFGPEINQVDVAVLDREQYFVGGLVRTGNSQGQGGASVFWDYE